MKFQCYASGSSGNLYTVSNETTKLMIECGVTYKEINSLLDYTLYSIDACLITHYHQDHCKAHVDITKAGIDIYMTKETQEHLNANGHRVHIIAPKILFKVKDFTILPFPTEHDAEGSVGFIIKCEITGEKMLFLTDSFYSAYTFPGLNIIAVECNYSEELLKQNIADGIVDEVRLHRIKRSHFSLENLINFLLANDLSKLKLIYIMHLSNSNAHAALIKEEVMKATGKQIILC